MLNHTGVWNFHLLHYCTSVNLPKKLHLLASTRQNPLVKKYAKPTNPKLLDDTFFVLWVYENFPIFFQYPCLELWQNKSLENKLVSTMQKHVLQYCCACVTACHIKTAPMPYLVSESPPWAAPDIRITSKVLRWEKKQEYLLRLQQYNFSRYNTYSILLQVPRYSTPYNTLLHTTDRHRRVAKNRQAMFFFFSVGAQDFVSCKRIAAVHAFVPPSWRICEWRCAKQYKAKLELCSLFHVPLSKT